MTKAEVFKRFAAIAKRVGARSRYLGVAFYNDKDEWSLDWTETDQPVRDSEWNDGWQGPRSPLVQWYNDHKGDPGLAELDLIEFSAGKPNVFASVGDDATTFDTYKDANGVWWDIREDPDNAGKYICEVMSDKSPYPERAVLHAEDKFITKKLIEAYAKEHAMAGAGAGPTPQAWWELLALVALGWLVLSDKRGKR